MHAHVCAQRYVYSLAKMRLQKHQYEHVHGMKKYTARSFSYFFKALLLVWHPSIYWAILSLAHEHTHMGICTQGTALAEDWIGFIHQSGIASLPLCCCDTPWNLGVSVRKEYFSNLCKDNYKC